MKVSGALARGTARRLATVFAAATLLSAAGCSGITQWALGYTGGILRDGIVAINGETDFEMIRWGLPGNLKTIEILVTNSPYDQNLLYMTAQGYIAYAYLVVEDDVDLADAAGNAARVKELKARASVLYARGQAYAARMLVRPGRSLQDVTTALMGPDVEKTRHLLGELSREDVSALFWYTYGQAGRINMDSSNPERIAELPRVELLLSRLVELDPGYFNGLPLILSGSVFAGRGAMFGGNLPKAKEFFDRAVKEAGGKFLLSRFTYARYYALQAQDRPLFCRLMNEVAEAPADLLPDQGLMNSVSQRWARRWRDRAPTLFEDGQGCAAPATNDSKEGDDGLL
jgi:hypothetical protein